MRTSLSVILAAAALVGTLAAEALAAAPGPPRALTDPRALASAVNPAARPIPVSELFESRSAGGAAVSPDGRTVVFSANISGRFNIWKAAVGEGGPPIALSTSDERQYDPVVSPDGRSVVFTSDRGGDELYDLYEVPLAGGATVDLTNTPDVRESAPRFSRDGALIAFGRKPKASAQTDVWVMDARTHAAHALTHEASPNQNWTPVAFTADGRALIADRGDVNRTGLATYRIDLATGAATKLTPGDDQHLVGAADISPDGRYLAVSSNLEGAQSQAALLDLKTGAIRYVQPSPWEEEAVAFSPDGRSLLYAVDADGRSTLYLYDIAAGTSRTLRFPPGVDEAQGQPPFTADGARVLLGHQAADAPADYWLASTGAAAPVRATRLAAPGLGARTLPPSTIVHYASGDGTVVSAFLVMPFNLKRDGSNPAVVIPHGGPTAQTLDSFSRLAAALASRGYVVIAPNVRGSTGYGRPFQDANIKDLGGGDLVDEVYAAKFLAATGYVDPKRIGITGGSYGGFMTLMAIGKTPDVWAAAVEQYGIINWYAMLAHEDAALQQYERGLIGDPVKDRAVYDATSPMTYIRQAKAPLLVLQGDNDIRVPKGQAEEVVATLKSTGHVVDAHYYEHEGHGFTRRENQIDALNRTLDWFDRYLKLPAR